jgi:DNA-binding GntR family transcriptional regulator
LTADGLKHVEIEPASLHADIFSQLRDFIVEGTHSANLVHRDQLGDAMREHEQIIDALKRRSANELELLMFQHMQRKCEAACECLRDQQKAESKPMARHHFLERFFECT